MGVLLTDLLYGLLGAVIGAMLMLALVAILSVPREDDE